jgi:hypothetical protein
VPYFKFFSGFLGIFGILLPIVFFARNNYLEYCNNKYFLSWDGNLRFVSALRLSDDLRNWNLISFIAKILDTPTWPPLRNLFQVIGFAVNGANPEQDIWINVITIIFLGLIFSFLISNLITEPANVLLGGIIVITITLLSPSFLTYTFSSMLEIQGSVFMLLSIWGVWEFLQEDSSQKKLYFLAISVFLLYFTKYPFGYVFLFLLTGLLLLLQPTLNLFFVIRYFTFSIYKRSPGILLGFPILLLGILGKWDGKTGHYLRYFAILVLVTDFCYYLYAQKKEILNLGYEKIYKLFWYLFFPIIFWTISHPDRFGSSSGTISHIQSEGKAVGDLVDKNFGYYLDFFRVLFLETWTPIYLGIILGFAIITIAIVGWYRYYKNHKQNLSMILGWFILGSVFGLGVLTPNHQSRHIYHLIPATAFIILVGITENFTKTKRFIFLLMTAVFVLAIAFFSIKERILTTNLCFSSNYPIYELPNYYRKEFPDIFQKNIFLLNRIEPWHYNHADTELVAATIAYNNRIKLALTSKEFRKNNNNYKRIVSVGRACKNNLLEIEKEVNINLWKLVQTRNNNYGCIEVWDQAP